MKRLYVLPFALSFLQGLLVPLVVLYMLKLGYGEAEIGIVTGSSSLLYITGALLSSFLVGKLGDSRTLSLSLSLIGAGYIALPLSRTIPAIFSAVSLVLLGFGVFWPSIENAVSSSGGQVSSFSFSWSSGSLLAMASVYPASLIEPKLAFLLFAASSLLLTPLARFGSVRNIKPASISGVLASVRRAALAWILCITYSTNSAGLITFYPILVEEKGMPPIMLSATLFTMIFSRTTLFYLYERIPVKLRRPDIASPLMLAPVLIAYTRNPLSHIVLALFSGLGQGIVYGNALERVFKRGVLEVHLYTSLFESFIGAGYFFGPIVGVTFSKLILVQPVVSTAFISFLLTLASSKLSPEETR